MLEEGDDLCLHFVGKVSANAQDFSWVCCIDINQENFLSLRINFLDLFSDRFDVRGCSLQFDCGIKEIVHGLLVSI